LQRLPIALSGYGTWCDPDGFDASNVVPTHSPGVGESYASPKPSPETIARAQQQLNRLANSSELAGIYADLGSEAHPLLSARAHEFDIEAFGWPLPQDEDLASLQTPVSANSMLFSSGYGVASLSFGGGGLGSAGSAAGAGSGGGSAGGQQSPSRDALLAAQGTSTDNRDLPGGDDNAADLPAAANTPHRFDTPGAPGRSGEPGTPHAAALTTLQESNSPSNASISVVSVPEPGTLLLMSAGLCGLGFIQRRRRG
jgi:hypothetical protein